MSSLTRMRLIMNRSYCRTASNLSLATSSTHEPPTQNNLNSKLEKTENRIKSKNTSISNKSDIELMTDLKFLKSVTRSKTTPLSLSTMYKYAVDTPNIHKQRIRNAQFLHRELQIRIADRALDLLTLPNGLSTTKGIRDVAYKYIKLLKQLNSFKVPQTEEDEFQFTILLSDMVLDRTTIPHGIARGLQSLKDKRRENLLDSARLQQVEDALYRFFTARVGLRFLMEHHILTLKDSPQAKILRKQHACLLEDRCVLQSDQDLFAGCIQNNCDPVKEIAQVVKQVTRSCIDSFGFAPPIQLVDCTAHALNNHFCYVPHHLRYMVAELLKNSCRATITHYANSNKDIPPIRIVVVKGKEDVTIKVADRGGGVSRSKLKDIWTFTRSTFNNDKNHFVNNHNSSDDIREFGLPLARIYARYFGGDITLKSCEGVGLDAYLYLPVLGDSCENLPDKVASSPGNLDSSPKQSYDDEEEDISSDSHDSYDETVETKSDQWRNIDALCQRAL